MFVVRRGGVAWEAGAMSALRGASRLTFDFAARRVILERRTRTTSLLVRAFINF